VNARRAESVAPYNLVANSWLYLIDTAGCWRGGAVPIPVRDACEGAGAVFLIGAGSGTFDQAHTQHSQTIKSSS